MGVETKDVSNVDTDASSEGKKDTVAYESHVKLLDQLKKSKEVQKELADKLKAFEDEKKNLDESKMKEQGEYKKILEAREVEIKKLKEDSDHFKKSLYDGAKLQAVLEKLPGKIRNRSYLSFIDIDKVAIDPESNVIDDRTVTEVVSSFVKDHSHLLEINDAKTLPTDSANGAKKLSYDEWRKLPLKEKKDKLNQVIN